MLLLPAAALQAEMEPCPPGFERYAEYRMFFGRGKPRGGAVSDGEWKDFLAAEVTPRFPDGLTVVDAGGQWRDSKGAVGREGTKLLIVLAEPGPDAVRRTEEIAEACKRAFDRQSVLRAVETVCAAFQDAVRFDRADGRPGNAVRLELPAGAAQPKSTPGTCHEMSCFVMGGRRDVVQRVMGCHGLHVRGTYAVACSGMGVGYSLRFR